MIGLRAHHHAYRRSAAHNLFALGLGGRLAIDATTKLGPERNHPWGEPLSRPAELEARLDERWAELGLADVGQSDPDPALFGYALERVLERLAQRG